MHIKYLCFQGRGRHKLIVQNRITSNFARICRLDSVQQLGNFCNEFAVIERNRVKVGGDIFVYGTK